jgi:hypothetical protein
VIAPATDAQPQHVHPTITVGEEVSIGYYTQLANGQLRVHATRLELDDGRNLELGDRELTALSPAFDLSPSNNPLPFPPQMTSNYDRSMPACYDIGGYMSAARSGEATLFAWGDNRNSWTSPPSSPAAGTHTQPDVFARRLRE